MERFRKGSTANPIKTNAKIKHPRLPRSRFPLITPFVRHYPSYSQKKETIQVSPITTNIQLKIDGKRVQHPLIHCKHAKQRTEKKVIASNSGSIPSKTLTEKYGVKASEQIFSFEHININGINPHDDFIELTNMVGILQTMGAGVYGINEHNLNTNNQLLMKKFWGTIKKKINLQK